MYIGDISAEYNGIVLFSPDGLVQHYGHIEEGDNLFKRFTTTEEGDDVLRLGIVVPILAIDSDIYEIVVRLVDEPNPFANNGCELVAENGVFALKVISRLVLADLAVLAEWHAEEGWQYIPEVVAGNYSVTVRGWRKVDEHLHFEIAGYEFELRLVPDLPAVTADTGRRMQLLRQPAGDGERD